METRGRHILIGAFVVAGFAAMMAFLMWFGAAQSHRQFAYYDVLFDDVSGITRSSQVRFAGLPVGQVQSLELDPAGSGKVRVRLEIDGETPVRQGSVATLEAQGVTGTSTVSISPGNPGAALLRDGAAGVPEIQAGRSTLQNLSDSAPAVLDEALKAIEQVNALLSPENRDRVGSIIANVDDASGRLSSTLTAADQAMSNVKGAVDGLAGLTAAVNDISGRAGALMDTADAAIRDVVTLKDQAGAALDAANRTLGAAEGAITTDLQPALADFAMTSARLRETMDAVGPGAQDLVAAWGATGQKASARLDEAEGLIADLRATAGALDPATVARLNSAIDTLATELPQITSQLKSTAESLGPGVDQLVSTWGATGQKAGERLDESQALIADLRATATQLQTLAETWSTTGGTASERLDEAEALIASLRSTADAFDADTMARLNIALDRVATDLPALTADLRAAGRSASEAFTGLGAIVARADKPISEFLASGLPQFTRLGTDLRGLVSTLDGLAAGLRRGPAGAILNNESRPEFRR